MFLYNGLPPRLLYCLLMIVSCDLMAARLQSVEVKQDSGKTSLFFRLDSAIAHKVFTLTNPNRVVVDFETTELAFNLKQRHLNNKLIKLVRSGHPYPGTLRLVFEVTDAVMLQASAKGSSASRQAFSFDISANDQQKQAQKNAVKAAVRPVPVRNIPARPLREVVIILDPGHGGKDPGAIGPKHTAEKNVTLAIASKLKKLIDRQPGMRAVLTRNDDYYLGLRERLKIARKYHGDVFISIHADAFINKQSNGASVFALSQRGATSEAAQWLAEKENYSELGGVNLQGLDDQSGLVRTVLIDLSQTATIGASLHMGEGVLRNLDTVTNLHNHKVEQARFMVLKSPDIPSLLIETGFISNPREESNLVDPAWQARLTQSVFQGLKHYFQEFPPRDTHFGRLAETPGQETVKQNKQYKVLPGDSLSKIASNFRISPKELMAANHLTGRQIKAGQILTLPKSPS